MNGLISFVGEKEDFDTKTIPFDTGDPFIAVFWAEASTYYFGSVSYRELLRASSNETLFCQVEEQIAEVFPGAVQFSASWMLVMTWHGLPFEDADDDYVPAVSIVSWSSSFSRKRSCNCTAIHA